VADALVLTNVEVDVTKGVANLKVFENAVQRTANVTKQAMRGVDGGLGPLRELQNEFAAMKGRLDNQATSLAKVPGVAAPAEASMASMGLAIGTAAAALGGLIFGIDKFADDADRITGIHRGFENLTRSVGETADTYLNKMRPASAGLLTDLELMEGANKLLISGLKLTSDQMADLAKGATELGSIVGVNASDAFERLTQGISRHAPLMLKQLGITINATKANAEYARSLGVSSQELDENQKSMAFAVEALKQIDEKTKDAASNLPTFSEGWRAAGNDIANAKDRLMEFVNVQLPEWLSSSGLFSLAVPAAGAGLADAVLASHIEAAYKHLKEMDEDRLGVLQSQKKILESGTEAFDEGVAASHGLAKSVQDAKTQLDAARYAVVELNAALRKTNDVDLRHIIENQLEALKKKIEGITGSVKEEGLLLAKESFVPALPAPSGQAFGGTQVNQAALQAQIVSNNLKTWQSGLRTLPDALLVISDGFIQVGESIDTVTVRTDVWKESLNQIQADLTVGLASAAAELGGVLVDAATGTKVAWADTLKQIIVGLVKAEIQALIFKYTLIGLGGFSGGGVVGGGGGGGSVPLSRGGLVPAYAAGGLFIPRGTDTVPAMLTPGEIVLPKNISQAILGGRASVVPAGGESKPTIAHIYIGGEKLTSLLIRNSGSLVEVNEYIKARRG